MQSVIDCNPLQSKYIAIDNGLEKIARLRAILYGIADATQSIEIANLFFQSIEIANLFFQSIAIANLFFQSIAIANCFFQSIAIAKLFPIFIGIAN